MNSCTERKSVTCTGMHTSLIRIELFCVLQNSPLGETSIRNLKSTTEQISHPTGPASSSSVMNVDPIQNACALAAKPCVNVSGHNTELNTVPLNITNVEDIESVGNIRRMSAGIYQEGRVMWLDTKVNLKAHIYALVILSGNSQLNVEKDFFFSLSESHFRMLTKGLLKI